MVGVPVQARIASQAEPSQAPEFVMEREPSRRVDRAEILATLEALRRFYREYGQLLEGAWANDAPDAGTRRMMEDHRRLACEGAGLFARARAVLPLLGHLVRRLRPERLTFRVPAHAPMLPAGESRTLAEFPHRLRGFNAPLNDAIGQLFVLARRHPATTGPRGHMLVKAIAALFRGILRQDWEDVALVLNHLNMVSTSRDSHELVDQIGRLVRSIYNSLNEISRDYPMESLSSATEEIPDAVEKLNSVILELENTANRNLDTLEALNGQVEEHRRLTDTALTVLNECGEELDALAAQRPEAAAAFAAVRTSLQSEAGDRLRGFHASLPRGHDLYLTLFANQSYQDLTGQTLKKVIAFIEGLQFQLIQVITRKSGKTSPDLPPPPEATPKEQGPDARNRLSQDKVDSLLADLGF
jgi:chemotaxis protein CheZ